MPVYDYRCPACQHAFDALRSVADRATAPCPECGENADQKIWKAAAIDWKIGTSPDFPTAYDRWAKIQRAKNTGEQRDSNNDRYGGDYNHKG